MSYEEYTAKKGHRSPSKQGVMKEATHGYYSTGSLVVLLSFKFLPPASFNDRIKPPLQLEVPGPRNTSRPRASSRTSPRMPQGPSCASPLALSHTQVRQLAVAEFAWSRVLAITEMLSRRIHESLHEEMRPTGGHVLYLCSPLAGRGPGGRYGVVAGSVLSANGLAVRLAELGGAFKPVIYAHPVNVNTRTPAQRHSHPNAPASA